MPENKPKLIVFAGPNGSGKTSITETLREHHWLSGCTFINPDEMAQEEFGGWNSEEAFRQAAEKAEQLREQCLQSGRSLAFETVLSTEDKLEFIRQAISRLLRPGIFRQYLTPRHQRLPNYLPLHGWRP